jgi:hypothetical protein
MKFGSLCRLWPTAFDGFRDTLPRAARRHPGRRAGIQRLILADILSQIVPAGPRVVARGDNIGLCGPQLAVGSVIHHPTQIPHQLPINSFLAPIIDELCRPPSSEEEEHGKLLFQQNEANCRQVCSKNVRVSHCEERRLRSDVAISLPPCDSKRDRDAPCGGSR